MKPSKKFLDNIRSLPEEARRFLAVVLFAAAALGVFFGWQASVSSRLIQISSTEESPLAQTGNAQALQPQNSSTPGPLAGIVGSVKALVNGLRSSLIDVARSLDKLVE